MAERASTNETNNHFLMTRRKDGELLDSLARGQVKKLDSLARGQALKVWLVAA